MNKLINNMEPITKLITLVLAISLASERLINFLKTIIPPLAGPLPPSIDNEESVPSILRKAIVMLLAFLASWLATSFLNGTFQADGFYEISEGGARIPYWIIALMASGGSAFWTNILSYTKSVKDIKIEKNMQEKLVTAKSFNKQTPEESVPITIANFRATDIALSPVTFTAKFSGGNGTLNIVFNHDVEELSFNKDESKTIDLPAGVIRYIISGAAAEGDGGAARLEISGNVDSDAPHEYGAGEIFPNLQVMVVNI